ncbi:uncharacterized protein LOC116137556 [Pistacia vera]|uniref:uncharacterized protein LOC116137556 n=1 Tax=Pistacia vera TaxID=55513 RepID=UPI0012639D03|nr:uncharacterized protein LOC116137556 [Pistacia vera]
MNARFQDLEQHTQLLHSHSQSISKLETQIGQIAKTVNRKEQGQLRSQVIGNPSGSSQQRGFFEQAKAMMTLQSGRELIRPEREVKVQGREEESLGRDQTKESENEPLVESSVQRPGKEKVGENEPSPTSYIPRAPFPQCLEPPNVPTTRKSVRMEEMIELFKQRRMKSHTSKTVHLPKNVSTVVSNRLPSKLKDPRAPIISCVIGNVTIDRALLDLGASVNLLPTSMYEQFNLGELKSTEVILQLADRLVKMPRGLIEDVLVKVEELYFLVDFLVLDMEYTSSGSMPPIILGRPFLAMANACINYRSGKMEVSFGNRKLRLNVFNAGLGLMHEDDNKCFMVDAIDSLVEAHAPHMLCDDAIYTLMNLFVEEISSLSVVFEIQEVSAYMARLPTLERRSWNIKYEPLPPLSKTTQPRSIESPPVLELKVLPDTLKYVFLGPNKTLPVIIAANLDSDQEERLVVVLITHKEAIGWSVADLRGTSPSLCMHHIFCKENAKPVHETQRRLNPNMKEVVKKEMIK